MAGSFGFERGDHYQVSIACGERILLPAVRDAEKESLIIADGFSCQEQIAQRTDRRAVHLAQVIQMALRRNPDGMTTSSPETETIRSQPASPARVLPAMLFGAGAILAGVLLARVLERRSL
jgi:hypothetical protein